MKYIKEHCTQNLDDIADFLADIPDETYSKPIQNLSHSTLGQHVRHIVEFYICLLKGIENGKINYDNRERNLNLENDTKYCIDQIKEITISIDAATDKPLILEGNYSPTNDVNIEVNTSVLRELAYCLEHSIHHQALLKVGLIELNLTEKISPDFGVAPATIRYRDSETYA